MHKNEVSFFPHSVITVDQNREAYQCGEKKTMGSRDPAGLRRLETATRMSASLFRRLSAFFGSAPGQDPKTAKFAALTPGPGMFVNVRNAPRVVIPPHPKRPVFRRVSRCVRGWGDGWRVYPPQPFETNVAAFVGDVRKAQVNPAPAKGN